MYKYSKLLTVSLVVDIAVAQSSCDFLLGHLGHPSAPSFPKDFFFYKFTSLELK